MLAAVYWARVPRVVLPDRALCLPTFCHSLLTVNKSSSSSSSSLAHAGWPCKGLYPGALKINTRHTHTVTAPRRWRERRRRRRRRIY